jgi:MFS transporter, OFA family, oxalate/formate antiporter
MQKNRWLIAASAVGIHISIGSVYAYSVMTNPINELLGWSKSDVTTAFSVAILFLGLSAAFLGFLVETKGPKWSGRFAAVCYGSGICGTGLAIQMASLPLFIFFYGALGGIGLGVGYITPVSTLVKWFPYRRGMATGMAIMGFGFASLIFGPLMAYLFENIGLPGTFYMLGALYFIIMFGSASYLEAPPEGWLPDPPAEKKKKALFAVKKVEDLAQLTAKEALFTLRFYYMWMMLFINVSCGIALISVASPMAQEVAGMTSFEAASMVGLMGLFNGVGRIGWASFSDIIGRPFTYSLFFIIQIIVFMLLAQTTSSVLFPVLVFIILLCYGGGFATVPAYLGDMFGVKELGAVHGYTLTAWAAAGLAGPQIVSRVREATGNYSGTLYFFSGMFAIALLVSVLAKMNIEKIRKTNIIEENVLI